MSGSIGDAANDFYNALNSNNDDIEKAAEALQTAFYGVPSTKSSGTLPGSNTTSNK